MAVSRLWVNDAVVDVDDPSEDQETGESDDWVARDGDRVDLLLRAGGCVTTPRWRRVIRPERGWSRPPRTTGTTSTDCANSTRNRRDPVLVGAQVDGDRPRRRRPTSRAHLTSSRDGLARPDGRGPRRPTSERAATGSAKRSRPSATMRCACSPWQLPTTPRLCRRGRRRRGLDVPRPVG